MPVKSDKWIIEMARSHRMIEPFSATQVRSGISYGVASYGYDISLANEFRVLNQAYTGEIDPRHTNKELFRELKSDSLLIPANSFVLARTREYFRIPRNVLTICQGKSTYARCGVIVNVTPFEPEWEGYATLSLSNTSPLPVRVYANQGIAQLIFLQADEICDISYADKAGKYQGQQEITQAKAD